MKLMFPRISAIVLLLMAATSSAIWAGRASSLEADSPEQHGFFYGSFGQSRYTSRWASTWPTLAAVHATGKLEAAVTASGTISPYHINPFTGARTPAFAFPRGSTSNLMGLTGMWVGGIVGTDTAVTRVTEHFLSYRSEMRSMSDPVHGRVVVPVDVGRGRAFRSVSVDTFTQESLAGYWQLAGHRPLGLKMITKSYHYDYGPYQNIVLLDYTFTNISGERRDSIWLGTYFDPSLMAGAGGYQDDLIGSFRELGLIYGIDNDGDPVDGVFLQDSSVVDGIGMCPVRIFPAVSDTNFNWWSFDSYENEEFAPRLRGTEADPYRDYRLYGFPRVADDSTLFYQLAHSEWDYDMLETPDISSEDQRWIYPADRDLVNDLAKGHDAGAILSFGSVSLEPDSSMRFVLAIFGGDFIHVDPRNRSLLYAEQYDQYFRNLHFGILRQRAGEAAEMADLLIGSGRRPTGLEVTYLSTDTVRLRWDPRVFPDIAGYNVYLTPAHDSFLVAGRFVRPGAEPDRPGEARFVAAGRNQIEITGLDPAEFYFASVAHVTGSGPGDRSPSIVIGYGNLTTTPPPPEPKRTWAFFDEADSGVVLNWYPPADRPAAWYRIYRESDSAEAQQRYTPFFAIDSATTDVVPKYCDESNGVPWCYYERTPYDSVRGAQTCYIDPRKADDAWYWITAISPEGHESGLSPLIRSHPSREPSKDILVILGKTWLVHDYVDRDSLYAFYNRLLEGYEYDLYDWSDTNRYVRTENLEYNVNWEDLARYRMIIVEELPSPAVLTEHAETHYKTLERLIASGRDLMYFGTPEGEAGFNLNTSNNLIRYSAGSFEREYFHLDSTAVRTWQGSYMTYGAQDSLAGFASADPVDEDLPLLVIDPDAQRTTAFFQNLFATDSCLPLTPAFFADTTVELLYTYGSAFPQTSELADLPCGLRSTRPGANIWVFSFHLWAMEQSGARELVDFVMQHQEPDTAFVPQIIPASFRLHQNYPNPFNPSTTIRFDLDRRMEVTLEVFNILGQRVATLIDRPVEAGVHEIVWRGINDGGSRVSTGIYFYRLRTDEFTESRKMLLLK